ncbi:MAG: TRAP transporter substrate-binding protein [Betaproteobacteria bacterium]|nr:TRAP transporter substrate-binding protein [Betaproteobacteria bacterium]MBI2959998.1 TRAP transporter substrate-binding protein [Betaproteobacteria bacterium]
MNKVIKKCAPLAAAAVLSAVFTVPLAAQPLVMKMGTATINDAQHEWMKVFSAAVEKGSNGRIKPEIYPASQLGTIPRMIEGTQFGSVQAWIGPPEFLTGVDSRYEVLSVPGVFKDALHYSRTFQDPEFSAAFLALGANRGLKGLAIWISGPLVVNTRTPVRKLADLEGKKVRVLASPMQTEQMRQLKATAVPMSLGEVMPALQQGTIDGMLASIPVLTAMRFYSAAKYLYESNYSMAASLAVFNKAWFDKLPPDLQKLLADSARKVAADVNKWSLDFIVSQRGAWIKAGGEITQPTEAERARIMKAMAPIGAEVTSKKPEEKAMFEAMMKAAKRAE